MTWIAVAVGGALGSLARHAVGLVSPSHRLPFATAIVNISGCLIIGILAGLVASRRIELPTHWREFLFVGLLGGFTTFSTFGLDTFTLARTSLAQAALNVAVQVVGGLAAVWIGYRLST